MFIDDGEVFISLFLAGNCLQIADNQQRPVLIYTDKLIHNLPVYTRIHGMQDIYEPTKNDNTVTRKLSGYCQFEFELPDKYESYTEWSSHFTVTLKVCNFTKGISSEYEGCKINFNIDDVLRKHYMSRTSIYIKDFFRYAKDIGFEIDADFLEEIIVDDTAFCEQVRLSRLSPNKQLNIKKLAEEYLANLDDISSKIIIQACEQAAEAYLSMKLIEDHAKGDVVGDNLFEITELFSEVPITMENIELLKNDLPDAWSKALFNHSESIPIEQPISFEDDDTPDNLYLALSAYKEIWRDFDLKTTNLPKRKEIEDVIKKIGVTDSGDIEAIARLIKPKEVTLGSRPNANKEKWQPSCDRVTQKVIN
jgi:hypothetical protein